MTTRDDAARGFAALRCALMDAAGTPLRGSCDRLLLLLLTRLDKRWALARAARPVQELVVPDAAWIREIDTACFAPMRAALGSTSIGAAACLFATGALAPDPDADAGQPDTAHFVAITEFAFAAVDAGFGSWRDECPGLVRAAALYFAHARPDDARPHFRSYRHPRAAAAVAVAPVTEPAAAFGRILREACPAGILAARPM